MPRFKEHDTVVLTAFVENEPSVGPGSAGTIIYCDEQHFPGDYLVEFSGMDGVPYAELWLKDAQLWPLRHEPITQHR